MGSGAATQSLRHSECAQPPSNAFGKRAACAKQWLHFRWLKWPRRRPLRKIAAVCPDTTAASSTTFIALPVHRDVVRALIAMHFLRPSPIQLHALPAALFGNDVIGQAKSGTGKTAVFGVTAVEHALRFVEKRRQVSETIDVGDPLALILAPTREIAVQIETVLRQLAQFRPEIVICTCIGGLAVSQDQVLKVAVMA